MQRHAVHFVMLFAMLWQSLALAPLGSTVNALADAEHAALHWQDISHHHHDDGSYHQDDSKESAQHLLGDQVSATVALMTTAAQALPPLASAAPRGLNQTRAPEPTLDGLLRPPRPHA